MDFRFLAIGIIFLLFLISFIPLCTNTCSADNNEIYINSSYSGYSTGAAEKPYKTIQGAIDAASSGDVLYVFGGLYQENIVIDKSLKIVGGIDETETVIDSRFDDRYIIEINADEVTLEYLSVKDNDNKMSSPIGALIAIRSDNNRIINNKLTNSTTYAIYIHSTSENNLVSSNYINKTKEGVHIVSSVTNDIVNNDINNCSAYGIYIDSSTGNNRLYGNNINSSNSGIYIKNSANVNITANTITDSKFYSIYLSDCSSSLVNNNTIKDSISDGIYLKSSLCTIKNNTFHKNTRGMYINGDSNKIYNNKFWNQSASGIYIQTGSNLNTIYKNKFIDNGKSAQDFGSNQWYSDFQGNYWWDYENPDKDLDGIGDVTYAKNGVEDIYPLGYFLKPPNKPRSPNPADFETGVGLSITLQVHVDDPDSDMLTVYFYNGDDDTLIDSTTLNPGQNVLNDSEVQCKFTLGFDRTFAWYVVADDGVLQNTSNPFIFATRKTPPDNEPPVANAGGPYLTELDKLIEFDSSNSYDLDGTIDFYRWNFGDGSSEILQENPIHKYENSGEFQVTLTIIDNNGSSATDITYISVGKQENDPPVARITLVETAKTEEEILFDGTESYDPDDDTLNFLWSFGNDDISVGEAPTYSYTSPGAYVVTLTVSDGELSDIATATITIKSKKTSGSPGFEILVLIAAIAIFVIINKKRVF